MMICSQTGARPHENAIAALKKEKTFGIVFIRDGKYVTQANPDDEVLEDVFNHKRPYCICIKAYKNDRKITGCFNPFLICESGVDTVLWAKKIMYPVGNLLKHADTPDVLYSNLMWAPKPVLKLENGGKKSNLGPGINTQQRAVLMLFTNEYELEYAK